MKILKWLEENKENFDWFNFIERWDKMQLVHNPFRNEQIETIFHLSGLSSKTNPRLLDLGCGPGTLVKYFLERKQDVEFVAIDIDPLLLAIFRNTISTDCNGIIQLRDMRKKEMFEKYQNYFDAVVSLTSLHWLSQKNQVLLYKRIYSTLKEGGIFLNGDPYLPKDKVAIERLSKLQKDKARLMKGETWDQFWSSIYSEYKIKDYHQEVKDTLLFSEDFEGTDDGYTVDFYLTALKEAGFKSVDVYWQGGLRIVYGGIK